MSMELRRERLAVRVSSFQEKKLWQGLQLKYKPLIHEIHVDLRKKLAMPPLDEKIHMSGEIFIAGSGMVIYYYIPVARDYLEAGCVLKNGEQLKDFQEFCEGIKDLILPGYRDREPFWKHIIPTNSTFVQIREEAENIQPTSIEMQAARALEEVNLRELLRKVKRCGSSFLGALAEGEDPSILAERIEKLESMGLVSMEYVVICRQSQAQISRASSPNAIQEATNMGFKCFACGRLISDEKIEQLVILTPFGQKMARPNLWLGFLLMQILARLGVTPERMLVREEKGYEVLNLFVNQNHHLVMFEIRDTPLRLDDGFLMAARVDLYKPDLAIFIASAKIPEETRHFLESQKTTRILCIEKNDDVQEEISQLLMLKEKDYVREVLEGFYSQTRIDIGRLLAGYFFGPEEEAPEVPEEEGIEPVLIIREELREPVAEVHREAIGEELIGVKEIPAEMVSLESTEAAEYPADVLVEEAVESVEEVIAEGLFEEQLLEEVAPEIASVEEMPAEARSIEEILEQGARKLAEEISSQDIIGRFETIDARIRELAQSCNCSCAMIDTEGLIVSDHLSLKMDKELFGALGVEMLNHIQHIMEEAGLPPAISLAVLGSSGRVQLYPSRRYVLVAFEEKKIREAEEEAGHLPGEIDMREAILKKVLEDLARIEGVGGNLVVGRDGLLIEQLFSEPMEVERMCPVVSQIVIDNEKNISRMMLGTLKQLLIRTPEVIYSLIPLDREGILATFLEPKSSREIWQTRLLSAATILTSVFQ